MTFDRRRWYGWNGHQMLALPDDAEGAIPATPAPAVDERATRRRVLRPCATPGCPALVEHGHCAGHATVREQARGTARQRGYDTTWARYSRRRLHQFPFCVRCGRLAEVTDHIVPIRLAPERRLDPTNHQSLCADCNRRKNIEEEGGFGREPRR